MLVCSKWHLEPKSQQSQVLREPHSPQLPCLPHITQPHNPLLTGIFRALCADLKYLQAYGFYSPRVACILLCEGKRQRDGVVGVAFLKSEWFSEKEILVYKWPECTKMKSTFSLSHFSRKTHIAFTFFHSLSIKFWREIS